MARSHRKRARTVDRDEAVDLLNTAFADGRLTAAEREDRVARALAATHLGDLDQVTSDLRPDRSPAAVSEPGWWQRTSRRTKVALAAALLVVVGGAVVLGSGSDDETVSGAHQAPYAVPVTVEALEGLIAEQATEFGTTMSYGVSLQVELTTLNVPTSDGAARYRPMRPLRDGGLEPAGEIRGAGEYRAFDLADVDLDALGRVMERARTSLDVPAPHHLVLVIQHWEHDAEPQISITVTNDYAETGYVVTDLGGEVLQREPFDPQG